MIAQETLDALMMRDKNAVDDFNNGPICLEARIALEAGRLKDICSCVIFLLKKEIEREQKP